MNDPRYIAEAERLLAIVVRDAMLKEKCKMTQAYDKAACEFRISKSNLLNHIRSLKRIEPAYSVVRVQMTKWRETSYNLVGSDVPPGYYKLVPLAIKKAKDV